ncbi:MAG TPA: hypothetical protein VKB88_44865 [Bryobacteraceae bacterium]|nr:hypothetical protein [Bryobacteraceae bacterium]
MRLTRDAFRRAVLAAAACIVAYQIFIPPIVGLADQGDFARMIGRFGYGPEDKSPDQKFMYVVRKYVPDPAFRHPDWEQFNSEYLFSGAAVALNRLISKDGKLDVTVMGLVHALAFLAALARLLWVTRKLRAAPFVWIAGLIVLTDAAYTAYWNSFYAEPASCIFFLLLAGESIAMCTVGEISATQLARWALWAALWVLAKPQNTPIGILLALFALRLCRRSGKDARGYRSRERKRAERVGLTACAAIFAVTAFGTLTVPLPVRWNTGYDMVFRAIIPESHDPAADLRTFGLDPGLAKYSGTFAEGHPFYELVAAGAFRDHITPFRIASFYLTRPARFWKHIKVMLSSAFLLRDFYGNFEKSAGLPIAARSQAFSAWSDFHKKVLEHAARAILFVLLLSPALLIWKWARSRNQQRLPWEFAGLLLACCLAALFTVLLGDCWDNIKHFFLFNLLFDACVVAALGGAATALAQSSQLQAHRYSISTGSRG